MELLDEGRLNVRLRNALSLAGEPSKPVQIRFSKDRDQKPWLYYIDPLTNRTSYVGRINGGQIAEIFKANRSRLLALNIRNYVGDNVTNREIRKIAQNAPENFYFFNNGISALATRIGPDQSDPEHRTLNCEQFSIINGAQAVRSLFKAQAEDPQSIRLAELLIRISEF